MHYFSVPVSNQVVTKPRVREGGQAAIAEQPEEDEMAGMTRYKVWGMTARILVDAARIAYGEDPKFEVCISSCLIIFYINDSYVLMASLDLTCEMCSIMLVLETRH